MLYWYRSYVLLCVTNDNLLVSNTTRVARRMGGGAGKGCPSVPCPPRSPGIIPALNPFERLFK